MDRRTLIAFVLATVVLIGWSLLFPTPRPKHPAPAVDSTVALGAPGASAVLSEGNVPREAGPTGGAIAEPVTPGNGGASWKVAQAETLEVDTDLLHARIHTHGGGLVGLMLKGFPLGDRSGPVNLVRAGQEALDVTVEWRPSTIPAIPLAGAMYAVTRSPLMENDQHGERIVLTAERADGLRVTREYRFQNGSYVIGHHVRVEGLSAPGGAPALVIGWRSGIPFTELTQQSDQPNFSSLIRVGDEIHLWGPGKFKDGPRIVDGAVRWAAVGNKYFMAAMLPAPNAATAAGADGDPTSSRTAAWLYLPAAASDRAEAEIRLYAGPKDIQRVEAVDPGLVDAVSLGYRWMRPITLVMVRVLKATYQVVPNYGWVIIILSILVRVLLFPLNQTSMRSMKAMQRLQPDMEAIRKKYADKPQEMNKQVMLLYQKHKVNPLGGCLPMVVQMPVLFALYFSLMFAIDLRMAPFVSWIHDLSAPDTVGKIAGFPIHVLPLIMTGVSVLQARSTPTDPRQAAMTTLMPIVFLVFFYNMPAGLVLYWTMTNLGTWLQQRWVNRMDGASASAAAPTTQSEIEASGPKAKAGRGDSPEASPESAGGLPTAGNGGRSRKEADRSMPKPRGRA
jgi:YidC/Oxa1 family membrane protein insertase